MELEFSLLSFLYAVGSTLPQRSEKDSPQKEAISQGKHGSADSLSARQA
jgi:hypothetical protein